MRNTLATSPLPLDTTILVISSMFHSRPLQMILTSILTEFTSYRYSF